MSLSGLTSRAAVASRAGAFAAAAVTVGSLSAVVTAVLSAVSVLSALSEDEASVSSSTAKACGRGAAFSSSARPSASALSRRNISFFIVRVPQRKVSVGEFFAQNGRLCRNAAQRVIAE